MLYTVIMEFSLLSLDLLLIVLILFILLFYWVFNFVTVYHLLRFGVGTQPKKIAAVFMFGVVTLFFFTVVLFAKLDVGDLGNKFKALSAEAYKAVNSLSKEKNL